MKVWITKYALTKGIFELEGTIDSRSFKGPSFLEWYHSGEWFMSREAAVIRAEQMRKDEIKSLKKRLAKMEALRFE